MARCAEPAARKLDAHDEQGIAAAGELLGLCFAEEPWSASLVGVLPSAELRNDVLVAISAGDVQAAASVGGAFVVDAFLPQETVLAQGRYRHLPAGVILALPGASAPFEGYDAVWRASLDKAAALLSAQQEEQLRARARDLEAIEDMAWARQACPGGFTFITSIAINPYYSGLGVLSAMLGPLLDESAASGLPLCLETYGERPRQIYEHKGFRVAGTSRSTHLALTQYRMVRENCCSRPSQQPANNQH